MATMQHNRSREWIPDTVDGGCVAEDRPWWHHGTALWSMALSSMCLLVSRLLYDPNDDVCGLLLHFIALGGSCALFATLVVLLVL